jgi:hypothetical protein
MTEREQGEDPTTQELRIEQLQREAEEREAAQRDDTDAGTEQHDARAAKAAYLRAKLEERAESERKAAEEEAD